VECPLRESERESGEVVRGTAFRGGGQETMYPVMKVPSQCSFVLLVEVMYIIGVIIYVMLERLNYNEI
jgi:hypothetical protein